MSPFAFLLLAVACVVIIALAIAYERERKKVGHHRDNYLRSVLGLDEQRTKAEGLKPDYEITITDWGPDFADDEVNPRWRWVSWRGLEREESPTPVPMELGNERSPQMALVKAAASCSNHHRGGTYSVRLLVTEAVFPQRQGD